MPNPISNNWHTARCRCDLSRSYILSDDGWYQIFRRSPQATKNWSITVQVAEGTTLPHARPSVTGFAFVAGTVFDDAELTGERR